MASLFGARREDDANDAEAKSNTNSKWLVGLVTGAGKLISSVFRSSEEEEESGSDEEEFEVVGDEDGGAEESRRMLQESNQDIIDDPKLVSPSKAAIEQLLIQETFSREESEKLINLIKSRITEPSSCPVLESEAISKAKQYITEKKKKMNSNLFEPCDNITHFGRIESDIIGSPIDVAKSYMLSKPPWKSYNNNSTVFKTPSRIFSDDVMLTSSSFPSSKGIKRDFVFTGLEDSSRRIRSKLTQINSDSKLFDSDIGGKQNEGLICEKNGLMQENKDPITEIDLNKTNMESEFESSSTGMGTQTETLETETLNSDVKKGRKRVASKVVSGRGRGRAKAAK